MNTIAENVSQLELLPRNGINAYLIGDVLIELTTPREPCRTLNPYGSGIQRRLRKNKSEAGFYAAVLTGGILTPDATIEVVEPGL